jgi:hypothetical protein
MRSDHPDKRCCACGRHGHRAHACPNPVPPVAKKPEQTKEVKR